MNLKNLGNELTEDDIVKFENELSIELPKDYKEFIQKNNGGIPQEKLSISFIEYMPESYESFSNETDIQSFSKLIDIPVFYNNLIAEGVIPDKFLPIACDSFGNEILLCVQKNNYGMIYFGNHEVYTSEGMYALSVIANSFSEFKNKLKRYSYENGKDRAIIKQ